MDWLPAARLALADPGPFQELARVPTSALTAERSTEHLGQLLDALRRLQRADVDAAGALISALRHHQMRIGVRGHLRHVGHAEHLMLRGQPPQLLADYRGAP